MSAIRGLASIINPSWNQLPFTRQCITALKSHTRPPWELIVIDNGSTDHTDIYMAGVSDGAAAPITVISNSKNLGFPAAINQWLKAACGEYLVLLNNDVVVTDGWLGQLIGLANAKKDVTAEHGELKTKEETDGRPAVDSGAGSGDPRTARGYTDVRNVSGVDYCFVPSGRTMESKVLEQLSPACPRNEGSGTQPRSCFNGNDARRVGREPAFVFPPSRVAILI
jgi:GT2 family glycosyltransferase